MSKDVLSPDTNDAVPDPPDADYSYSAKGKMENAFTLFNMWLKKL